MIEYPKILISGDYNAFNEGWNGCGVYMCSGNYKSDTFKFPIYIGSAVSLQKRIEKDHINDLERGVHEHNHILLNSWNKYGKESFIWYLLEMSSIDDRLSIEQKYLDLYRPFVDEFGGFNIAKDARSGSKGRKMSKESREKMSNSHKGKPSARKGMKLSKEHIEQISKRNSGKRASIATEFKNGSIPWNKGIKCSEETRKKLSESNKGRIATNKKKVLCIETGIIYPSLSEAAKENGIKYPCNISFACNGKIKSCGGFHWRYIL